MPVILRVLWIIMFFYTVLSFSNVFYVNTLGHFFFGVHLFGLYAVNIYFVQYIFLPVIILVGMYKRSRYVWIFGIAVFFIFAVEKLASLSAANEIMTDLLSKMPDLPREVPEEEMHDIFSVVLILMSVLIASLHLAICTLFFIKRNYFLQPQPEQPQQEI
jgi:hypothetical protein